MIAVSSDQSWTVWLDTETTLAYGYRRYYSSFLFCGWEDECSERSKVCPTSQKNWQAKFISLGPVPVSLLTYLTIWDKYKWCLPLNHGFTFGKCFSPASPATWHQPLPKLSESWLTNRKGASGSLAICRAEKLDATLEWRAPRLRLARISKTEIKSISEANGKLNAELSTLSSEWKHHSQDN